MSYFSMLARVGESLGSHEDYLAARKRGVTDDRILMLAGVARAAADEDDAPDRDDGQAPEPTEKKKGAKTVKKKTKKAARASAPVDLAKLTRTVARMSAVAAEEADLDAFDPSPTEAAGYVEASADRLLNPPEAQTQKMLESLGFASEADLRAKHAASVEMSRAADARGSLFSRAGLR